MFFLLTSCTHPSLFTWRFRDHFWFASQIVGSSRRFLKVLSRMWNCLQQVTFVVSAVSVSASLRPWDLRTSVSCLFSFSCQLRLLLWRGGTFLSTLFPETEAVHSQLFKPFDVSAHQKVNDLTLCASWPLSRLLMDRGGVCLFDLLWQASNWTSHDALAPLMSCLSFPLLKPAVWWKQRIQVLIIAWCTRVYLSIFSTSTLATIIQIAVTFDLCYANIFFPFTPVDLATHTLCSLQKKTEHTSEAQTKVMLFFWF